MDRNRPNDFGEYQGEVVATREGGVDRNRRRIAIGYGSCKSPPARVAWIETTYRAAAASSGRVATREGGVDRNFCITPLASFLPSVATREGGVDRNPRFLYFLCAGVAVATREGGVDRNNGNVFKQYVDRVSPPARVAWIETTVSPVC